MSGGGRILNYVESLSENTMGDFLRAQRARLTPAVVGLPAIPGRRVGGLRREEVAVLAGVSADYYARLEQGRERTPSAQVAEALSAALRLGPDAREYLFRLARLSPSTLAGESEVTLQIQQTLDAFPNAAAIITNSASRIVASNVTASALFAPIGDQASIASGLFLHPRAREFYVDWENAARAEVCTLRISMSYSPAPREVSNVVATLLSESEDFRSMWQDVNIAGSPASSRVIEHPDVGLLRLAHQRFDVRGAAGLELVVLSAAPGSQSADALVRLGRANIYALQVDTSFEALARSYATEPRELGSGSFSYGR